jgi:4-hydroxy-tetrahydrodipicolinate reductase
MVQVNAPAADGKARVILWGLGALGRQVVKAFGLGVPNARIVGAVDHDPSMVGKTLAEIFPGGVGGDIVVHRTLHECLAALDEPADVVYHMTESVLAAIQPQLELALARKLNVISASEAMFHPGLRFPDVAASLDRVAREHGVTITGCGINPGFVFDTLVMALARVTTAVTGVQISRTIEVYGTGPHDIDHVGYGLWPDEFREKVASGRVVGHMGMPESIAAIAERLAIPVDRIEESWETSTADFPVDSGSVLGILEPGRVIGITQQGAGYVGERAAITMRLAMFYNPARHGLTEADEITIEGSHRVHATLQPAAVSIFGAGLMIVNATYDVLRAGPGLMNVLDASLGGAHRGGFRLVTDPARPWQPGRLWLVPQPLAAE